MIFFWFLTFVINKIKSNSEIKEKLELTTNIAKNHIDS